MAVTASAPQSVVAPSEYDIDKIRSDFPILEQQVHGKPLVYLDNAASAQKPRAVIDRITKMYSEEYSNVHRGVHLLSARSTQAYEDARETARAFINAASGEVIFLRGTTEAVNLVANTYGRKNVGAGDEILISAMEHHSNIVPWQMLCEETGAQLKVIPINERGELELGALDELLTEKTKLVALVHVSNALGTINPVEEVIKRAHALNVPVFLDGAQAAPHTAIDVQRLGVDFYAFSGHKVYGPSGVGVLYGREALLEAMPPYQGGGDMIATVTFEKTTYAELPAKFEAGTPNIAGVVGLAAALDYVSDLGLENIAAYEDELLAYGTAALQSIPGLRLVGTARRKAGVLGFVMDDIHPHDLGTILDLEGIAVRTGHHCAQPVMDFFKVPATARASLGIYNTRSEIDALVAGLHKARKVFTP